MSNPWSTWPAPAFAGRPDFSALIAETRNTWWDSVEECWDWQRWRESMQVGGTLVRFESKPNGCIVALDPEAEAWRREAIGDILDAYDTP